MAGNKQCFTRLQREYKSLLKVRIGSSFLLFVPLLYHCIAGFSLQEPLPQIEAHPSPASLLEWHFVLRGAEKSDYQGGVYHGKLVFPAQYPYKPPSISMITPTGRFAVNTKLCLSITDFHPESWNPLWSVGSILNGLLSFMHDSMVTTGSITTSPEEKRRLAQESLSFNMKNPTFRKVFPEWVEEHTLRSTAAAQKLLREPQAAVTEQGTAAAPKAAKPPPALGSSLLTVVAIVVALAIALVPLIGATWKTGGGGSSSGAESQN
jgi:ubiquitin-conjugating enzyme E2 J2